MIKRNVLISGGAALLAAVLILTSGCAWSVGGSKTTAPPPPAEPTLGEQLIDLKKAHEQGAISDEEYEAARARMLEQ
jgi:hypothetical protein